VAAPIFARIAQPVLEYLNVPHDVEVRNPRRELLRASVKAGEVEEGSPDHLGEDLALSSATESEGTEPLKAVASAAQGKPMLMQASQVAAKNASVDEIVAPSVSAVSPDGKQRSGTVVLDLGAGAVVPSFLGKPLREVVEQAQQAGIEVDVLGSGLARQQNPPPGSHLSAGTHVAVRFAR
jgi:cell division protein FtsI (penicillin-binding protein 3)